MTADKPHDSRSLFFILIFLLLFYDDSFITGKPRECKNDSSLLFFILIYLKLFY